MPKNNAENLLSYSQQNPENALTKRENINQVESYTHGIIQFFKDKLKPLVAIITILEASEAFAGGYAVPPPETGKKSLAVKWGAVENADSYTVEFSVDRGKTLEPLGETADTIMLIPNDRHFDTPENGDLMLTVKAKNECGESEPSDPCYVALTPSECNFHGDEVGGEELANNEYCSDERPPIAKLIIDLPDGRTQIIYGCKDETTGCSVLMQNSLNTITGVDENATNDPPPDEIPFDDPFGDPPPDEIPLSDPPTDDFMSEFFFWENASDEIPLD